MCALHQKWIIENLATHGPKLIDYIEKRGEDLLERKNKKKNLATYSLKLFTFFKASYSDESSLPINMCLGEPSVHSHPPTGRSLLKFAALPQTSIFEIHKWLSSYKTLQAQNIRG